MEKRRERIRQGKAVKIDRTHGRKRKGRMGTRGGGHDTEIEKESSRKRDTEAQLRIPRNTVKSCRVCSAKTVRPTTTPAQSTSACSTVVKS